VKAHPSLPTLAIGTKSLDSLASRILGITVKTPVEITSQHLIVYCLLRPNSTCIRPKVVTNQKATPKTCSQITPVIVENLISRQRKKGKVIMPKL